MIEIKGDERIEWMYPEIYDKDNQSTLEIGMCHTRAADSIRIKYDSDRDGWIIEQSSIFEWDINDEVCDPDWKEVAFIQAWGREKPKLSDNSGYVFPPTATPKLPSFEEVYSYQEKKEQYPSPELVRQTYEAIKKLGNFA